MSLRTCLLTLTFSAIVAATAIAKEPLNELSAEMRADGWQLLFDGKSIDDWTVKSGFATYRVQDGAIVGTTAKNSPNSFLVTPKEYGDFDLRFQVKLDSNPLNSGVQIRSKLKGDQYGGRVHGPQAEIEASPGQSGFIYGEALGTGWLSPEPNSKEKDVNQHAHFKNGEWNDYRIRAEGDRIQTWINGEMIADLTLPKAVAEKHAEGLIGLQVHGVGARGPFTVRWRNLYLKPLK